MAVPFTALGLALAASLQALQFPVARRDDVRETRHGIEVRDPYRWMENMDSPEVLAWARAQDILARRWIRSGSTSESARAAMERFATSVRYSTPIEAGARRFYLTTDAGGRNGAALMVEENGRHRLLLEPLGNGMSIGRFSPDPTGRYLAYAVRMSSSRWETWRILDVEAGSHLPDSVSAQNTTWGRVKWSGDGRTLYYVKGIPPRPGQEQRALIQVDGLYAREVGSAEERLIFRPRSPDDIPLHWISDDGRYLVWAVAIGGSTDQSLHAMALGADAPARVLADSGRGAFAFVGNRGASLLFYTTRGADNGHIVAYDLTAAGTPRQRAVVAERPNAIDTWFAAAAVGERIVVGYREDARFVIRTFDLDGRELAPIELPGLYSAWSGMVGRQGDDDAWFQLSGFYDPGTIYHYNARTGAITSYRRPDMGYDVDRFVTRLVHYRSADGTRVPLWLAHRRDMQPDASTPTILYGYGVFNWASSPWFQSQVTAWLEQGGMFAVAGIRGGSEYGEEWRRAGILANRGVAMADYLAAAEYLVAEGISSPRKLVANGGSASGPLAGMAVIERPDLFAAAIIDFPALDMVRLDQFTGGRGWRSEFGSSENPEEFPVLLANSPYHQVREGVCYPPIFVDPGSRDETTPPFHAYKFVAAMQRAQTCDNPILLRISWGAGHSFGATLRDQIDNWADQIAFLDRVLGEGMQHSMRQ